MQTSKLLFVWLLALAVICLPKLANANSHSEGANGDLSNSNASPTSLSLTAGSNLVTGTNTSGDRDYLVAQVPTGLSLTQVILNSYSANDLSFSAMQIGTSMVPPSSSSAAGLSGYSHYGNGTVAEPRIAVGENLLAKLSTSNSAPVGGGPTGFSLPLGPGTYTFLFQQTNPTSTNYQFNFVVTPEPSTAVMAMFSMIVSVIAGKRRR